MKHDANHNDVSPVSPRTPRWVWRLPWIAAILLPISIGALLWLLQDSEREEQRIALITDVLWIEQSMRFQMDRNVEQLRLLGAEMFDGGRANAQRAKTLIDQSDSLAQISWLTPDGRVLNRVLANRTIGENAGLSEPQLDAFHRASRLGKVAYSEPYGVGAGDGRFDVYVPHYINGKLAGVTVGAYSAYTLLTRTVPWWFTERYRITMIDARGEPLAANSSIAPGKSALSYQLPFEPLGGVTLSITAYGQSTRVVPLVFMIAIVALAAAILLSLRAARGHMQRRLRAEHALRGEYAFRKAMEDSLLTGLRARDLEGRIIYVNPAFCRMVGWSAEELIGRTPPMPYWPPEEVEQTKALHDRILAGSEPYEAIEVRYVRKNGERFDALLYEAPLIDAEGRQTGWMGSALDITARKRAEELYRQQQEKFQFTARLMTMGEMASMVAHELNQPLSAISSYATGSLNLLRASQPPAEMRDTLQKIVTQAQRAGHVIRRVHEFVRRREPRQEACDIDTIVEDAMGLIEPAARQRGVRLQSDVPPSLPRIRADRVMIEQVLINLSRNGMDAMAEIPGERRLLTLAAAVDDNGVRVSVIDRGRGIAADAAARLYEPFFSTKNEGMGIGLNICRSIVELHKGRLWFEANRDGGTQFHLWLPAAA